MAIGTVITGVGITRDLLDAGDAYKNRSDPLAGFDFLRAITNAGSRLLPPNVGRVVREISNTWSADLRATGEKIIDANQRIQDAAEADGVPGFPPANPTPPGMEWQPTITVSADGTSFSQGPSRLVPEGTKSSTNEYYGPNGNRIYPPDGGWANPKDPSKPWNDNPPDSGLTDPGINPETGSSFTGASNWRPPVDPLILDLDSDGLETIGISTTAPIFFDHNGDGVKTATGWVKPDDGFLVLDRNGNGTIDTGRELFGDSTPLAGGGNAITDKWGQTRFISGCL